MVRPLIDEKKLANIEHQDWNSLRPEFRYRFIIIFIRII